MAGARVLSWGRVVRGDHLRIDVADRGAALPLGACGARSVLPYGNGRSYGDSCLNAGGALLSTRRLDRFISFDPATGILRCEAGVLLSEILRLVVPQGWFLAVTPGTRFISVGGAIANDVHGKNHHGAGCFGAHVRCFELLRSDGSRQLCSRAERPEWFAATVGGLGLTGLITWAELQLRRVANPWIAGECIRFRDLDEFFALSSRSERDYEYSVAWVDCAGRGRRLGRGLFMAGNHAPAGVTPGKHRPAELVFPLVPPVSLVNALSLRAFNAIYYHRQRADRAQVIQHYEPFFYPLDGVREWNRMYGPRGFYQYQSVIPMEAARDATLALLDAIGRSGLGSFLAVLKVFGAAPAVGMLSFPHPGVTLALDFPNTGARVHRLFERLDAIVSEARGRLYPAKDGRMPGAFFRRSYRGLADFGRYVDPRFSSSFWRRVMETA